MEFIRKISLGASAEYEKCKTFDEKKNSKLVQKFVKDRNVSVYAVSPNISTDRILVASSLNRKDRFGKIRFSIFSGVDLQPEFVEGTTLDMAVNKLHYEYRDLDDVGRVNLADAIVVSGDVDELSRCDVKRAYDKYKKIWRLE